MISKEQFNKLRNDIRTKEENSLKAHKLDIEKTWNLSKEKIKTEIENTITNVIYPDMEEYYNTNECQLGEYKKEDGMSFIKEFRATTFVDLDRLFFSYENDKTIDIADECRKLIGSEFNDYIDDMIFRVAHTTRTNSNRALRIDIVVKIDLNKES